MTTPKSSKLAGLLQEQADALRINDYRKADRLSQRIDAFIHTCPPGQLPPDQQERIEASFAQLELTLAAQKQDVSLQLQRLRQRKRMLKAYQDQVKT